MPFEQISAEISPRRAPERAQGSAAARAAPRPGVLSRGPCLHAEAIRAVGAGLQHPPPPLPRNPQMTPKTVPPPWFLFLLKLQLGLLPSRMQAARTARMAGLVF